MLRISFALIGMMIGAGFASGQEILQYFTIYGFKGVLGSIIATILFAYAGMVLTGVGSRLQTDSYKEAIYKISGPYLGVFVDVVIVITCFGVGVVMIAGAGSLLAQQFDLPVMVGNLMMIVLILLTLLMKVDKVIVIIGSVTPFLILTILILAFYNLVILKPIFIEWEPFAFDKQLGQASFLISTINYASFNIIGGAGMAILIGTREKNVRIAETGGLIGGLCVGVLMILSNLIIFSQIHIVALYDLPLLKLMDNISPILSFLMTFVLFGMIFNTAVSVFYAFLSRFFNMEKKQENLSFIVFTCLGGFLLSFIGFKNLVSELYTFIGWIGLPFLLVLLFTPFILKNQMNDDREN